jgi:hypothetical protein
MHLQSEVTRLLAQIDAEYSAAHAALYGLSSGTARHDIITAKMERVQTASAQLIEQLGADAALPLIIKAMEGPS